jgi:TAZ zinc finger
MNNVGLSNAQNELRKVFHCVACSKTLGQGGPNPCSIPDLCLEGKNRLQHILKCNQVDNCPYPLCTAVRGILTHYTVCSSDDCMVCAPLRVQLTTEPLGVPVAFMEARANAASLDQSAAGYIYSIACEWLIYCLLEDSRNPNEVSDKMKSSPYSLRLASIMWNGRSYA